MKDKLRSDKICITCKIHTVQVNTMKGWACKNCGTLQTLENIKKEAKDETLKNS